MLTCLTTSCHDSQVLASVQLLVGPAQVVAERTCTFERRAVRTNLAVPEKILHSAEGHRDDQFKQPFRNRASLLGFQCWAWIAFLTLSFGMSWVKNRPCVVCVCLFVCLFVVVRCCPLSMASNGFLEVPRVINLRQVGGSVRRALQAAAPLIMTSRRMLRLVTQANDVWREIFVARWPKQNAHLKVKSWYRMFQRRWAADKDDHKERVWVENCAMVFECPLR
jgi:hypothetical protein